MDIGTTAHFKGIALVQTAITLRTGVTASCRLLAQMAVTLDANTLAQPACQGRRKH
ncbi:MAG: ice-binding family protein [Pseudomonadota bacterium]